MEEELIWEDIPEEEQDTATAAIDATEAPISESAEGSSDLVWEDVPEDKPKHLTPEVMGDGFKSVYTTETQDLLEFSGRGTLSSMLGVAQMVEDFGRSSGLFGDKLDDFNSVIDDNEERISELGKKLGYTEEDFTNPSQVSKLLGEALPLTAIRKLSHAVGAESMMGFFSSLGQGDSYITASVQGTTQGIFTKLGGELGEYAIQALRGETALWKNLISGKASEGQAYNFVIKQSGATPKEVSVYNQDYATAIGKKLSDFTEADKINAIMNNSEVAGKFKVQAELYSDAVGGNLKKLDEQMRDMISETTKGGDFNIPLLQFKEYAQSSGFMYGEVKDILLDNFNVKVAVSDDILSGIRDAVKGSSMTIDDTVVTKRILNTLENSDELDIAKLLEMRQDLNSLNLKSTKAFKAGEIGKLLDGEIHRAIGDEGFYVWKDVNKRYATKMILESDNPIAKIFSDSLDPTASLSAKQIANKMLSLPKAGYNTFNSMREVIGEEAMAKVEKEIIKTAMQEKGGLSKFMDKISNFEFSTVEGRSIQSELSRIKGAIPEDDVKKLLSNIVGRKNSSVGWSDNIVNKARFAIIGKLWDGITRRMPSASGERALLTLGDTLKNTKHELSMDIRTDIQFQKAFINEQQALRESIANLKAKGKARTSKENKELVASIADERKISSTLDEVLSSTGAKKNPRTKDGTESLIDIKLPKKDSR